MNPPASFAPRRRQPSRCEHDQQRLAAPPLLIEALFPIHPWGRDPVGGIKVERRPLVTLTAEPVLERLGLGIVRAAMADKGSGHRRVPSWPPACPHEAGGLDSAPTLRGGFQNSFTRRPATRK